MLDFFNAEELTEYVDKTEDTDGTNIEENITNDFHHPFFFIFHSSRR
jgi:hypothetical protein